MEDTFKIRSYGFGELAQLYLPNIQLGSATKRLRYWIKRNPALTNNLEVLGYNHRTKLLAPSMVREIIAFLGEP